MTTTTGSQPLPTPHVPIGRIPVIEVSPTIENGRWPTKAVVGEVVPIRARVFREGHDAVGASLVLIRPDGTVHSRTTMNHINPGLSQWTGECVPDAEGLWSFRVEGWSDPYATWAHDADIKVEAGIDVDLMLEEGARVMIRAAEAATDPTRRIVLEQAAIGLRDGTQPAAPARIRPFGHRDRDPRRRAAARTRLPLGQLSAAGAPPAGAVWLLV